jgi:hypothetical protein
MRFAEDADMTVDGLPLHPLVVHATVVVLPVAALLALGYCVPRWREALRWPLLGAGVLSALLVWLTAASGDDLRSGRFATVTGQLADRIAHHEDLAGKLEVVTYVFAAVCVLAGLLHGRGGALRAALAVLTAAGGIAVVVLCVLTGDAGARAAWG